MLVATALLLSSCNVDHSELPVSKQEDANQTTAAEDVYEESIVTDSRIPLQGSARKMIHTMGVKFQTKDVQNSVAAIERFTLANNGIVEASNTTNRTTQNKSVKKGTDSLRNAQVYTTVAEMTIRMPVDKLDTLSGLLASMSQFTNYRKLNRNDVTFNLIGNELKSDADKKVNEVINKNTVSKNVDKAIAYTDRIAHNDADRELRRMEMLDEVAYATVNLELYQPDRALMLVVEDVDAMVQQTFLDRLSTALSWSFNLIKAVTLFAIAVWPVWLTALIAIFVVRRRKKLKPIVT